jgi:spore coat polysaccharide biosynthesis protein SpsF
MKSSRLPGKALKLIGGYPLVERVIRRAQLTGYPVVLATSNTKEDDELENLMTKINVPCFRGSEDNVLERAVLAAEQFGFRAFARLCGDRPLFSIEEMTSALSLWQEANESEKPDLITNHYPVKAIRGLTTEVVKTKSLRSILEHNPNKDEEEHLTLGFYNAKDRFNLKTVSSVYNSNSKDTSGFAVDTEEDFKRLKHFVIKHPDLNYELELNEIELV